MDAIATATLEPGKSFPLGASLVAGGANFSVFSKHASAVQRGGTFVVQPRSIVVLVTKSNDVGTQS